MTLALNADLQSTSIVGVRAARAVAPNRHPQAVFVDPSGRRARWCRRLLAATAAVALSIVVILAALTVAFVRSAAPEAAGRPAAPAQRPAAMLSTDVTAGLTTARR